jgi:hypothetical protein
LVAGLFGLLLMVLVVVVLAEQPSVVVVPELRVEQAANAGAVKNCGSPIAPPATSDAKMLRRCDLHLPDTRLPV